MQLPPGAQMPRAEARAAARRRRRPGAARRRLHPRAHVPAGAPAELPDAATNGGAAAAASPDYFPAGGGGLQPQFVDHRAAMEERERQVLVSSLARVLQGRQCYDDDDDDDTDVASPAPCTRAACGSGAGRRVVVVVRARRRCRRGAGRHGLRHDGRAVLGPFGTDSNSYDGNLTSTRCFDLIN